MALTRKKAIEIYRDKGYDKLSDNNEERLQNYIDTTLNDKDLVKLNKAIDDVNNVLAYNELVDYTLNELPLTSHRPRRSFTKFFYVINSKANKEHFKNFKNEVLRDIKCSVMPLKVTITAYKPIPSTMNKIETVLCEMGLGECISTPDVDNIFKTYTDTLSGLIFMDDRLIIDMHTSKRYSLKPRIEVHVEEQNCYVLKHNYKNVTKSISYNKIEEDKRGAIFHYTDLLKGDD